MATTDRPVPSLATLPPELLDNIANCVPTASSLASLSRTNRALHDFVEKDGWRLFARARFPSLYPQTHASARDVTRTLTSLARAWDRYAFVAQYVHPDHDVVSYPGHVHRRKWARPQAPQTIGFAPLIDVSEEIVGSEWKNRRETLVYSAGAELCVRHTSRENGVERQKWQTYKAHSSREGPDDITSLHLLRPQTGAKIKHRVITGTARGDLQLLHLPPPSPDNHDEVGISYFATQGVPIRGSTLYHRDGQKPLLAANLGDRRIALYDVDAQQQKIVPSSELDLDLQPLSGVHRSANLRTWCAKFLSSSSLAVGLGTSAEPIHIYNIDETGFCKDPVRRLYLGNRFEPPPLHQALADTAQNRASSSVFNIVPLGEGPNRGSEGQLFLSGAYDGIIRLHDLRSPRDVEQVYIDPADDSAIYSLLPFGHEKIIAGSSRHSLMKVFDLRLGARRYSHRFYRDLHATSAERPPLGPSKNFNLFLRPNNLSRRQHYPHLRASGHNSRSMDSSVYSLASAGAASPFIYAGLENAIMCLVLTELADEFPDPLTCIPPPRPSVGTTKASDRPQPGAVFHNCVQLAMYEQGGPLLQQYTDWNYLLPTRNGTSGNESQHVRDRRWIEPQGRAERQR